MRGDTMNVSRARAHAGDGSIRLLEEIIPRRIAQIVGHIAKRGLHRRPIALTQRRLGEIERGLRERLAGGLALLHGSGFGGLGLGGVLFRRLRVGSGLRFVFPCGLGIRLGLFGVGRGLLLTGYDLGHEADGQ